MILSCFFSQFSTHAVDPNLASLICTSLHKPFLVASSFSSLDVHGPLFLPESFCSWPAPQLAACWGRECVAVALTALEWESVQFPYYKGEFRSWLWKQKFFFYREKLEGGIRQNSKMSPRIPTSWGRCPAQPLALWACWILLLWLGFMF